jgi:hypothetical protein
VHFERHAPAELVRATGGLAAVRSELDPQRMIRERVDVLDGVRASGFIPRLRRMLAEVELEKLVSSRRPPDPDARHHDETPARSLAD